MRCLPVLLIMAMAVCAVGARAASAVNKDEVYLYKGDDPNDVGMTLGDWGSGKALKTKDYLLIGPWSIAITSQSLYCGGRMDFAQPVTLFSNGIDPKRYVQFSFFFGKDVQVINPAAKTGYQYDVEPYTVPVAKKLHFVFVSDTGATVSAMEQTNPLDPDDNWMRVVVPLSKFKTAGDNKEFHLKRLLIGSSNPGNMYLGEIKLLTDDSPITVDQLDTQTVEVNDPVYFMANARGGVSSLKYSWDFDAGNGIQTEQIDRIAFHTYKTGGDFTVTLTVSDADGLKSPVTVTGTVTVTD